MQLEEDRSMSHVAKRFMGTDACTFPLARFILPGSEKKKLSAAGD